MLSHYFEKEQWLCHYKTVVIFNIITNRESNHSPYDLYYHILSITLRNIVILYILPKRPTKLIRRKRRSRFFSVSGKRLTKFGWCLRNYPSIVQFSYGTNTQTDRLTYMGFCSNFQGTFLIPFRFCLLCLSCSLCLSDGDLKLLQVLHTFLYILQMPKCIYSQSFRKIF